jgi:hypothetical protein
MAIAECAALGPGSSIHHTRRLEDEIIHSSGPAEQDPREKWTLSQVSAPMLCAGWPDSLSAVTTISPPEGRYGHDHGHVATSAYINKRRALFANGLPALSFSNPISIDHLVVLPPQPSTRYESLFAHSLSFHIRAMLKFRRLGCPARCVRPDRTDELECPAHSPERRRREDAGAQDHAARRVDYPGNCVFAPKW